MQLDNLNKIPFKYIFSYILAAIYKISLNNKQCKKLLYNEYFRTG